MRLPFGYSIVPTKTKSAVEAMTAQNASSMDSRGSWLGVIRESFTGAWQKNVLVDVDSVLTHSTVWACISLIAHDISKLWIKLVEEDAEDRIKNETDSSAFSPVLRDPNHYQTRVKFIESWLLSLLTRGNTYVLKERDNRNVVVALYVLDPQRVRVLVAPNGNIYYDLGQDWLAGLPAAGVVVPASEVIHDVGLAPYHPLCGLSPLHACGIAAMQGLKIQSSSLELFSKGLQISGIITSPHAITTESADRIEKYWVENYLGSDNVGKIPVLGDGLMFQPRTSLTAVDAQLIDQLKWSAEFICSVFHIPPYMVGIGAPPANANVQALTLQYYSQALQAIIENIEELLTKGLALPSRLSVEFDLKALLRMDTATLMKTVSEGVGSGVYTPNEGRAEFDLKPVTGGDSPMMQQQWFSLAALSKRDQADPFAKPTPAPAAIGAPSPTDVPKPAKKHLENVGATAADQLERLLRAA